MCFEAIGFGIASHSEISYPTFNTNPLALKHLSRLCSEKKKSKHEKSQAYCVIVLTQQTKIPLYFLF